MRHDRTSFTTWTNAPVDGGERIGLARDDQRRVVLLRAVEFVRKLIVDPDAVDLRRRLVHLRRPGATAVSRDICAAIVRLDHDLAVFGIDPDVVIVAVRRAKRRERFATVGRFEETFGAGVDDVGISRIGAERRVVKRTLNQRALRIDQRPRLARVVRAIETAAWFCFDESIDAIGFGSGDGEIGFADQFMLADQSTIFVKCSPPSVLL